MITIYRSDFNGNKDTEGREYFDYLIDALGVMQQGKNLIHEVNIEVASFKLFDEDGVEIAN